MIKWRIKFYKKRILFFLSYVWARLTGTKYYVYSKGGLTVRLGFLTPYHHSIAKALQNNQHEDWVLGRWVEEVKRPHAIVHDVGGFSGIFGLLAAKANPETDIHIFEPDPINARQCRYNVDLNGLSNCHVHEVALSDENKTVAFNSTGNSGASIARGYSNSTVKCRRLEDYPVPDLMKIDAEGEESGIILSSEKIFARKPIIFLEVHNWVKGEKEMWNALSHYTIELLGTQKEGKHYLLK